MPDGSLRRALLYPETVALIGASSSRGRITARPQTFLRAKGFQGTVYPVNPGRDKVLGEKAYASIQQAPGQTVVGVVGATAR